MVDMEIVEYVIHHCLKGAGRICKAEEHDQWFKQAVFHLKCALFLVSCLDPDVIIAPSDIKLCEDVSILNLTYQVGYKRQWVAIADGVFVQLAIILHWM